MSIFRELFTKNGKADAVKVYLPEKEARDFHGKLLGEVSFDFLLTQNRAMHPALHPDRLFFIVDFEDTKAVHEECEDINYFAVYVLSRETRYKMTFGGGYVQAPTPTTPGIMVSFEHTYWEDLINWYLWYIENQVAPLRGMEKTTTPGKGYSYWARKRYLDFDGFSIPEGPSGLTTFRIKEKDPIIGNIVFERLEVPLEELKDLFWTPQKRSVCKECITKEMFEKVWKEREV